MLEPLIRIRTKLNNGQRVHTLFSIHQWVIVGSKDSEVAPNLYEAGQRHLAMCQRLNSIPVVETKVEVEEIKPIEIVAPVEEETEMEL
jgi:hypothetical protein